MNGTNVRRPGRDRRQCDRRRNRRNGPGRPPIEEIGGRRRSDGRYSGTRSIVSAKVSGEPVVEVDRPATRRRGRGDRPRGRRRSCGTRSREASTPARRRGARTRRPARDQRGEAVAADGGEVGVDRQREPEPSSVADAGVSAANALANSSSAAPRRRGGRSPRGRSRPGRGTPTAEPLGEDQLGEDPAVVLEAPDRPAGPPPLDPAVPARPAGVGATIGLRVRAQGILLRELIPLPHF